MSRSQARKRDLYPFGDSTGYTEGMRAAQSPTLNATDRTAAEVANGTYRNSQTASPVLAALTNQTGNDGVALTPYQHVAATDADGGTITYSATLADGRPLPSWLTYTPSTRTFSGTPTAGATSIAVWNIRVRATDRTGRFATRDFTLTIT